MGVYFMSKNTILGLCINTDLIKHNEFKIVKPRKCYINEIANKAVFVADFDADNLVKSIQDFIPCRCFAHTSIRIGDNDRYYSVYFDDEFRLTRDNLSDSTSAIMTDNNIYLCGNLIIFNDCDDRGVDTSLSREDIGYILNYIAWYTDSEGKHKPLVTNVQYEKYENTDWAKLGFKLIEM